ncbi:hypothetical protein EIN_215080 [Entamoeba invadens IP1]|uniref:EamA domain-containing protein n=1 Tax=Entamoeba invadens IP1 TaxID=370355 RepID=A0A0A1UDH5_ENTIV|nr:hypothetical protein EIN_215080 [Entamoeba invadens IP1]ELP90355.1 hypothetical protein EIN_215080 [Entamoeba invadens IP1]|eukprot:XP_004257126.1 hypothetical protein EIN_215080 [Entamoeba invadens IP1]
MEVSIKDDYVNPKTNTTYNFTKALERPELKKSVIIVTVILFLCAGTTTITLSKMMYNTTTFGRKSELHPFEHPMFLTFMMFVGMAICIVVHIIVNLVFPEQQPKHVLVNMRSPFRLEVFLAMIVPAFCDFLGGYLMNVGLLYVTSSVFQMMRGSVILFTALLAVFVRKVKLLPNQVFSLFLVIVALAIVGGSAFAGGRNLIRGESKVWDVVVGITFITGAMFLQATQTILEEKYLLDLKIPPLVVVGLEGFYGVFMSLPGMVILQLLPAPFYDDSIDAVVSLREKYILVIVVFYVMAITVFNIAGMIITQNLSAMVRNILDPCRMITIWMVSVILYYSTGKSMGEPLGWQTCLQVLGFVMLTSGLFIYTGVWKMNIFGKDKENEVFMSKDDDLFE